MAHIRVSVNDAQAASLRSLCAQQNLPFIVLHIGCAKGGDNPRRKKFTGRTDFCDYSRSAPTGRRIITADVYSRASRKVRFGTLPKNQTAQLRSGLELLADRRRLIDKVLVVP
jgi:hypothetical protein